MEGVWGRGTALAKAVREGPSAEVALWLRPDAERCLGEAWERGSGQREGHVQRSRDEKEVGAPRDREKLELEHREP